MLTLFTIVPYSLAEGLKDTGAIDTDNANNSAAINSGTIGERVVSLGVNTSTVSVNGGGTVRIKIDRNKPPNITISGDDKLLKAVSIEQDKLAVRINSKKYKTALPLVIDVMIPNLSALSLANSGTVYIDNLNTRIFYMSAISTGDILINSGQTDKIYLSVTGAGEINASNFTAKSCKVSISGEENITLWCSEQISGVVKGKGNIKIFGNPAKRALKTNGTGTEIYY